MFLFFCAVCFASELPINWMNELSSIVKNLKVTEAQARQMTHGDFYDFRKLPVFIGAFRTELENDITSEQVEAFIDKAESLLIAHVRKNKIFIPGEDLEASHPLAKYYAQLKDKVLSQLG